LKNLLLAIATVVIMLCLAEAGLHGLNFPAAPEIGWRWSQSPYRSESNKDDHQTNQLGLRGQKIEYGKDDFVVVLLGDSQVEAGTQPADQLPEILLEKALQSRLPATRVKVFSIASAGWGQDQQFMWLKKYFENYRADLVLAWPTPVNDYWENTFIDRSVTPTAGKLKPTWGILDGKLEQIVHFQFDWKLRNLVGLAVGRAGGNPNFTLEQFYSNRWQATLPSPVHPAVPAQPCPTLEVLEPVLIESYLKGLRSYTLVTDEDIENGRSHFTPFLKNKSPRDHYAIELTHLLLQDIAQLSIEHGATFKMFHPYRSDLDAAFREIKCVKTAVGAHYFEFDGSDWLRFLKASRLKDDLISLTIQSTPAMRIKPGDWHLSAQGNAYVMAVLADTLLGQGLLQKVRR